MNQVKCEVCKRDLPMGNTGPLCWHERCKIIHAAQIELAAKREFYDAYFIGKTQDEATYFDFFKQIGLEEKYQAFINPERTLTRRTYYHLNVASTHYGWTDEFARPFKVGGSYGEGQQY
jgi:hypothetical protein